MFESAQRKTLFISLILTGLAAFALATFLSTGSKAANEVTPSPNISAIRDGKEVSLEELPRELQASFTMMMEMNGTPESRTSAVSEVAGPEGEKFIFIQTDEQTCLLSKNDGSGPCGSNEQVALGKSFSAYPVGCDAYMVVGIMPDGVEELSIASRTKGAAERSIPVVSNIYHAKLGTTKTTLTSADDSVKVTLPLDWYTSDNDGCTRTG